MHQCREGIDLVLNSRVASVGRNCVTVVDSKKSETSDIPFGACVWATGVAMHPLVKQLQVGFGFEAAASYWHMVDVEITFSQK